MLTVAEQVRTTKDRGPKSMEASDISEVMEHLFGQFGLESRLFAYCITRGEMMLMADGIVV